MYAEFELLLSFLLVPSLARGKSTQAVIHIPISTCQNLDISMQNVESFTQDDRPSKPPEKSYELVKGLQLHVRLESFC